jgi:hypothetical protein
MKPLFQNLCLFLISCLIIASCSAIDEKKLDGKKIDSSEAPKAIEKKKFFNITPPEKNISNKKGVKLSDLLNLRGNEIGSVNKYLWQASIEILNFLPIKIADPFSGIIAFDKGKVPGSSKVYDATVYIKSVVLDAESLSVSVRDANGNISYDAKHEIENAILSRARKLRIDDLDK